MSISVSQALQCVSPHRAILPLYFVRPSGVVIATGVAGTHGGAVILDDWLQFVQSFPSKSAALSSLRCN